MSHARDNNEQARGVFAAGSSYHSDPYCTTATSTTMPFTSILLRRFSSLSLSTKTARAALSTSTSAPSIVTAADGRQYAAVLQHTPKLKPHIVQRRIARLKTYEGKEKDIRHSPWRLNLVCQFAAGLPLEEAIQQLEFNKKSKAPLVKKILERTANLADIRDGLQPSQLEVAECFATHGKHLKRIKMMGRGRYVRELILYHMIMWYKCCVCIVVWSFIRLNHGTHYSLFFCYNLLLCVVRVSCIIAFRICVLY